MTNGRRTANLGLQGLAALIVSFSFIGIALADDVAKTKKAARKKDATPQVITRTEEHEDVDGHERKPETSRKPKGPPTLKPGQIDALILKGLAETKTPFPSQRATRNSFAGSISTSSARFPTRIGP